MATSSFFYGGSTAPEQNTVDELIDALNAAIAAADEDRVDAEQAAQQAADSASNAALSEQNTAGLAQQAQTLLSQTETAAAQAATSATSAGNSANNASASAAAALASQNAAAGSAATSSAQATIATNAANSATASQTASAASAVAADASADASAASAAAALASEAAALTSRNAAAASQTAAAASQSAAATSASAALTSQNAAAASASSASGSASAASASQTAAAASAAAAAASFDSFDDRYLGAKTSDPTVDNDGAALLDGALYWNSVSDEFRAWNGSSWEGLTGLPSVSGQAGKFLSTNGTTALWANVPDPQPATPLNDGLVYGNTDDTVQPGWSDSGFWYWNYDPSIGNGILGKYSSSSISSGDIDYWFNSVTNLSVGDPVSVTVGGSTYNLGTILELAPVRYGQLQAHVVVISNPSQIGPVLPSNASSGTAFSSDRGGNVSLGYGANDEDGAQNTTIGYGAGSSITTGSNLTVVGYDAEPSSATATNEATFGNSATTNTRVFGALSVGGSSAGTSGQFLKSNGAGVAPSWAAVPDPQPATPTNDGLVYGYTEPNDIATSSIPFWYSYYDGVAGVDYYQGLSANYTLGYLNYVTYDSPPAPTVGDRVYIDQVHPSTGAFVRTIDLGTITHIHFEQTSGKYGFRTNIPINLAIYAIGGSFSAVKGTLYKKSASGSLGGNVSLGQGTNDKGARNTSLGYGAGSTITTGSNLTVIGYDAEPSSATATNEVTLGNSSVTRTRLFGALAINNQTGTSGQVLTSNGTGTPTWQTPASSGGDVVGPASSTDNAIARFDGTTGKLVQNSTATVSDTGDAVFKSVGFNDPVHGSRTLSMSSGRLVVDGDFDTVGTYRFGNGWCSLSGGNADGVTLSQLGGGTGTFLLQPNSTGIVETRSGTNPITFRVYNTYTDGSNYERGFFRWNTNVLEIGAEAAGTGTARGLAFFTHGVKRASISTTGIDSGFSGPDFLRQNDGDFQQLGNAGRMLLLGANAQGLRFDPAYKVAWSSTTGDAYFNIDTALARDSAGVVKVTNGSTGLGVLKASSLDIDTFDLGVLP